MVSMESELGQMGPGVGCLEVERKKKKCLLHIEVSSNHCLKTLYDLYVFTSESEVPFSS